MSALALFNNQIFCLLNMWDELQSCTLIVILFTSLNSMCLKINKMR